MASPSTHLSTASSSSGSSTLSPSSSHDALPTSPLHEDEEEYAPSPSLVAAYDGLMSAHLPPLPSTLSLPAASSIPPPSLPPGIGDDDEPEEDPNRPMTKAEKQNAKKKRRKERERMLKAAAAAARGEAPVAPVPGAKSFQEPKQFPFRLFAAIKPVSLVTEESYALPTNPRLRRLPDALRERIARVAAEAAVNPPTPPRSTVTENGPVWVAEHGQAPPAFLAFTADVETKCTAVPRIRVHLRDEEGEGEERERNEAGEGRERRKRRCRRRKERREFPAPDFWRPPKGVVARGLYGWSL